MMMQLKRIMMNASAAPSSSLSSALSLRRLLSTTATTTAATRSSCFGGTGGQRLLVSTLCSSSSNSVSTTTTMMAPRRAQSTAAAAAADTFPDEEEHRPDLSSSMTTTRNSRSNNNNNNSGGSNRLQALRERLRNEANQPAKTSLKQMSKKNNINNNSVAEDKEQVSLERHTPAQQQQHSATATATTPMTKDPLEDMRQLLARLPDPPAATTADDAATAVSPVLHDSFQRQHTYLRLSLTERCNLRCTYCMPAEGVPLQPASHLLQTSELLQLAHYFRHAGVHKFRLTGGEPTLRADLLDIVRGLQALQPTSIGMTTNGVVLYKQLPALVEAGLTHVNLSLDTLHADTFARLTRRPAGYLDRVWESLTTALDCLSPDKVAAGTVKINCVVMRGVNDHEVPDFCRLTEQFPALQIRFIEYMPFTDNGWGDGSQCVPYAELLERCADAGYPLIPLRSEDPHDTTKWYTTTTTNSSTTTSQPKLQPRIGFITSMSEHFCASCNRLRLTADGNLKVCLFDGRTEVSLRDALRVSLLDHVNDDELQRHNVYKLVYWALQKKQFSLGGHANPAAIFEDAAYNRPMTLIGG